MTYSGFRDSSSPLFKKLGLLNIYKLHKLGIGNFIFDLYNKNLPHDLSDYFQEIDHSRDTRFKLRRNLAIPKIRTAAGQFSIRFSGTKLWNSLPTEMKCLTSKHLFRKAFKEYLLDEI